MPGPPSPKHGGPLTLLRFLWRNRMLSPMHLAMYLRLLGLKLRLRRRLQLDGIAFVHPGVKFEVGKQAVVRLGRWSWVGGDCRIRVHEGVFDLGSKSVLGQQCTISAFQHISIGRECVIADRVMLIDFDHALDDVERPIRLQGIHKRAVKIGHNCWIGYGVSVLCGVAVGDNAVLGAGAVVTRDVPNNAVAGGIPARVLRVREVPRTLTWDDE